ncbi:MAG: MarR family transcriptional regulator [Candidatus Heimdallarchaeota archaeon]|nr:MarR family transcriptional regulator [Candidatus Heimdallarchaeota archaeon]
MDKKEELFQLLSLVAMGLTGRIMDFCYKGMEIGRLIFCIHYIGFKNKCSMTDLADFLSLKPSTATRQLDKLVDDYQLVKRTVSSEDRRVVELELTKLGREVYYHHKEMGEVPTNLILDHFSDGEQKIIKRALQLMLSTFEEN